MRYLCVALLAVGGCTTIALNGARSNFPSTSPIKIDCGSGPSDEADFSAWLKTSYEQGWRLAAVGTSTTSFLVFASTKPYVCIEKEVAAR